MSYKALMDKQLLNAFNLIKDLAIDVVLVKNNVSGFDFGTGQSEAPTSQVINTKAILVDSDKRSRDRNVTRTNIMFKTKDVSDITLYDHVLINNIVWKFGPILRNSGFIILAEIFRET